MNKERVFERKVTCSVVLFMIAFTACSSGSGGSSRGASDVPAYSMEVGSSGGVISDPRGAVVIIPPGALDTATTIKVKTYQNRSEVMDRFGMPLFSAGVELLPEGLQFNRPVTVTVPSGVRMTPGERRAISQYDEARGGWKLTGAAATVDASGTTVSYSTTHFCVTLTSPIMTEITSTFAYLLDYYQGDSTSAFNDLVEWFVSLLPNGKFFGLS